MKRVVRITRVDLLLLAAGILFAGTVAALVHFSTVMVAPPRPRISTSARPALGLALRQVQDGPLVVQRAMDPARHAGLEDGDRIVRLNDADAPSLEEFATEIASAPEGTRFTVEARRKGENGIETGVLVEVNSQLRAVSPADEGVPFETVAFQNPAGLTLRGWYVPAPGKGRSPAVVYGHGNGSDRRQWLPMARRLRDAGIAQLFLDFAGRGDSDGEVITLGARESEDLRAAVDWLSRRSDVDPKRIGAVGKSMGAVAAILAASHDPRIRVLVLDSPFADLADVVDLAMRERRLPAKFFRPLLFRVAGWRASFDPSTVRPEAAIAAVEAPALLLHGEDDRLVPIEHARRLERSAGGPVTFVPLPGEGHNTRRSDETLERITRYLEGSLSR